MNQRAIEEAIAQRIGVSMGDRPQPENEGNYDRTMLAAAYMEKLCQNVWRLPAVREPEQVLCELLEQTIEDEAILSFIRQGLKVPTVRRSIVREPIVVREPTIFREPTVFRVSVAEEGIAPSTYQCMPPNPRRLKGLANLIGRLSSRLPSHEALDEEEMILEARLLLITAYIYQFHHDLHIRWEADLNLYNEIRDWCRTGKNLPFKNSLKLPLADVGPTESQPFGQFGTTYPDPTQSGVFWIQPLILHLETEIAPQRFERYLHGVPT